jgi:hypothetical protein
MALGTNSKSQALKFGAAGAKLFEKLCDVGEKELRKWMPQGSMYRCFRLLLPPPKARGGHEHLLYKAKTLTAVPAARFEEHKILENT